MKEPPNEGPDDWYFDESWQRWGRHSGRARWRAILAERRSLHAADPDSGRRWLRERLGITFGGPSGVASTAIQHYPKVMDQDTDSQESMRDMLARAGIVVTDEGLAHAKRRLAAARARQDPEKFEALRQRFGLTPRTP